MAEKVSEKVATAVDEIKEAAHEIKDTILGPLVSASGGKPTSPDQDTAQETPFKTKQQKQQKTGSEEAVSGSLQASAIVSHSL